MIPSVNTRRFHSYRGMYPIVLSLNKLLKNVHVSQSVPLREVTKHPRLQCPVESLHDADFHFRMCVIMYDHVCSHQASEMRVPKLTSLICLKFSASPSRSTENPLKCLSHMFPFRVSNGLHECEPAQEIDSGQKVSITSIFPCKRL